MELAALARNWIPSLRKQSLWSTAAPVTALETIPAFPIPIAVRSEDYCDSKEPSVPRPAALAPAMGTLRSAMSEARPARPYSAPPTLLAKHQQRPNRRRQGSSSHFSLKRETFSALARASAMRSVPRLTSTSATGRVETLLRQAASAVDSHQPSPAHQAVSSGIPPRRRLRISRVGRVSSAAATESEVASSRAPMHRMNAAAVTTVAAYASDSRRVTNKMQPRPSFGVRGKIKRPPTFRASSQRGCGCVAPALT